MQYCPEWSPLTLMGVVSQSKGHKESPSENNCAHLLWIFKSPDGKVCADRLYSSLLHGHESTKWGNIYFILFQVSSSTQFSFPLGDNFILSCKHSPVYSCNYLVTQCTSSTKHKIQHTSPGLQLMSTSNIRIKKKSVSVTAAVMWVLMPDGWVWVFLRLLVSWDFHNMKVWLTNLQKPRDPIMSAWTSISNGCFQHLVESMA